MDSMDGILLEGPEHAQELICLIHGWPDDLHLWDHLVAALLKTGRYRCLRVTLPGYGDRMGKVQYADGQRVRMPVRAPNFDEVARLIADVILQKRMGEEQVTLIAHDWGSVTGIQLQRQFPSLVRKMVLMDIGPIDAPTFKMMFAMGAYYQWFNQLAFLIWRDIPVIGENLGNWMHRISLRRFKTETWNKGPMDQSASAAYYYHHFQKDYWLQWLGRSPQTVGPPLEGKPNPSCPTLFLYGEKGLGGGFKPWYSDLHKRSDSDVLAIPGNHWFMLKSPEETSSAVLEWLGIEGGGKLKSRM